MTTKYTPEPWKFLGNAITSKKHYFSIRQGSEDIKDRVYPDILITGNWDGLSYDERKANTILAVASPKLLKACKALLVMKETSKPEKLDEALTWRQNDDLATKLATEAIAEAEGKTDND